MLKPELVFKFLFQNRIKFNDFFFLKKTLMTRYLYPKSIYPYKAVALIFPQVLINKYPETIADIVVLIAKVVSP